MCWRGKTRPGDAVQTKFLGRTVNEPNTNYFPSSIHWPIRLVLNQRSSCCQAKDKAVRACYQSSRQLVDCATCLEDLHHVGTFQEGHRKVRCNDTTCHHQNHDTQDKRQDWLMARLTLNQCFETTFSVSLQASSQWQQPNLPGHVWVIGMMICISPTFFRCTETRRRWTHKHQGWTTMVNAGLKLCPMM